MNASATTSTTTISPVVVVVEKEEKMREEGGEHDLEWEEWDGRSPFLHHCVAGSVAGVAEHTLLYPVDTVKTHMQSYCAACPHNPNQAVQTSSGGAGVSLPRGVGGGGGGMWGTLRGLVSHNGGGGSGVHGNGAAARSSRRMAVVAATTLSASAAETPPRRVSYARLWRGVQTVAVGCVPAHALYFSSYEAVKAMFADRPALGSGLAGAAATVCHDLVMTPLDTVKQRLQLGHYGGTTQGLRHVVRHEGWRGLYRSFPVTLATNVPYGAVMVSTNEFLKSILRPEGGFDLRVSLAAGCGAGLVASALTTPLDRVKTRLQTQNMGHGTYGASSVADLDCREERRCRTRATQARMLATATNLDSTIVRYSGWRDALRTIVREEGAAGLFRGVLPRVLMHSPAVAISWTTYEGTKKWLLSNA